MNIEIFISKVYSIAFILTGDEGKASELSISAIICTVKNIDSITYVNDDMFKRSVILLCKLFLDECEQNKNIDFNYDGAKIVEVKEALLKLNPLNRVIVILRDVLSFKLTEITQVVSSSKKDINLELANSRRILKEFVL